MQETLGFNETLRSVEINIPCREYHDQRLRK